MSAIAGLLLRDNAPLAIERLHVMVDAQRHRGPDGTHTWGEGPVALGQLMMHSTPEAVFEQLPLVARDGAIALVGDVRLDNRDNLIADLGLGDVPASLIPDGRIVLAAYERWGERCPEHLLGDFAFAIWDARRRAVYCARDHFGVRPLFYYLSDRTFALATEIKGLFALEEVPVRVNELRVAELLTRAVGDQTVTFYEDVSRLAPAHWMLVSASSVRVERYYQLDPSRELRLASTGAYAEAVRETFIAAVSSRMRCTTKVGAQLSGGMDSSSIACVARNLLRDAGGPPLDTFSAVYDVVSESDEREYIQAVLATGHFDPYLFAADAISPLTEFDDILTAHDEAMWGGNHYLSWQVYKEAQRRGVRVLLDGFDGDNTISHGLGLLTELAEKGRWLRLAKEVRAYSLRSDSPDWPKAYLEWVQRYAVAPALRRVKTTGATSSERATPGAWARYLRPELIERTGLLERRRAIQRGYHSDREKQYHALIDVGESRSLDLLGQSSSAFGVEVRYPYWDKRLVELCLSIPAEQKLHNGWSRMLMRHAMKDILPEKVRWRGGKANYLIAFDTGFRSFEHEQIKRIIFQESDILSPFLDIEALQTTCTRYLNGVNTEEEGLLIWRAVSLALWLRRVYHRPRVFSRKEVKR